MAKLFASKAAVDVSTEAIQVYGGYGYTKEYPVESAPSVISSGCPYCLTMLSDGTKAKEVEETVSSFWLDLHPTD